MSEERVARLNAARSPATRYAGRGLPEVRNRLKHERSARRLTRADPSARALQRQVNQWSAFDGPEKGRRGGLPELSRHVSLAPARTQPLYRGIATTEPFKRGVVLDLPLSSFTTSRKVAERFATHRAGQIKGSTPIVIEARGARALHVAPLARTRGLGMQEWVAQGQFKVTRGGASPRMTAVTKMESSVMIDCTAPTGSRSRFLADLEISKRALETTISAEEARRLTSRYGQVGPLPKGLSRAEKMQAYEARYVTSGAPKGAEWAKRSDRADRVRTAGTAVGTAAGGAYLAGRARRSVLGALRPASNLARSGRMKAMPLATVGLTGGTVAGAAELYGSHARRQRSSYASTPGGVAASALRRMRAYTPEETS